MLANGYENICWFGMFEGIQAQSVEFFIRRSVQKVWQEMMILGMVKTKSGILGRKREREKEKRNHELMVGVMDLDPTNLDSLEQLHSLLDFG
jgi:hypothetical protein